MNGLWQSVDTNPDAGAAGRNVSAGVPSGHGVTRVGSLVSKHFTSYHQRALRWTWSWWLRRILLDWFPGEGTS